MAILANAFSLITPDFGLFFWTMLTFALLWFILGKFAFGPIGKSLRERSDAIENSLKMAEKARAEMAAKVAKTSKITKSNKVAKASKIIKKLDSNSKLLKSNVEIDGHKLAGSNLSNGFAALMGANLALN